MRFDVEADRTDCELQLIEETDGVLDRVDLPPLQTLFGGDVSITYPRYPHDTDVNNPLPLEFAAYGTAPAANGHVTGTMTPCDTPPTDIEEEDPQGNWTLNCYIVNPSPPCTLTVSQVGSNPDSSDHLYF